MNTLVKIRKTSTRLPKEKKKSCKQFHTP